MFDGVAGWFLVAAGVGFSVPLCMNLRRCACHWALHGWHYVGRDKQGEASLEFSFYFEMTCLPNAPPASSCMEK
jgi:hypothetical protein